MFGLSRQWMLAVLLTAVCSYVAFQVFGDARSSDLMAMWLAGKFLHSGQTELVYMTDETVFSMQVDPAWYDYMAETYQHSEPLFPFIYPPLWAWLAGLFQDISFFALEPYATALNAALLGGIALLGARIAGQGVSPVLYVFLCLLCFFLTQIGTVALYENQPQILVSFLILLALERARNGSETTAGLALALAASLKVYPALLALLWLATGQRRAFFSFAAAGALLGLLSIAVAGWPLQQQFIEQMGRVAASSIVSALNWNVHAVVAQLFYRDELVLLSVPGSAASWYLYAKPVLWTLLTQIAPFLLLALAFPLFRRADADTRDLALWPAFMIVLAMLAPIAWAYHFLPAIALLPSVLGVLGTRFGTAAILAFITLLGWPTGTLYRWAGFELLGLQLWSTVLILCIAAWFVHRARAGLLISKESAAP